MRQALAIHAQGIERAVRNESGLSLRDKAYTLSAELFFMQHTCHWFCKSRAIASARLMARHQTPHAQVLASVTPATRAAYSALLAADPTWPRPWRAYRCLPPPGALRAHGAWPKPHHRCRACCC
jgi:acyl transferase domain-containing protein